MYERVVIVGGGQAAVQAIDTLRRKGFTGELVMIGDEPWLPYQRPPLSKKYLAGALERERLLLRPQHFYESHSVETRLGRRVEEIGARDQRLRLDDGATVAYDALLIATGSRPRPLAAPGADLEGVYFLRTIADVEQIRARFLPGRRLVIVGGGYIGLEVAATAREAGLEVTVLEMADRVMNRVVCSQLSAFYEAEHARHGSRILCNSKVRALAAAPGSRHVRAVVTEDGQEHAADTVVVGCGVLPADELAVAAGLACENGVVVDDRCRTSDPVIYAAGDCTSHPSLHYGRRMRLESVDNAFEQGSERGAESPRPRDCPRQSSVVLVGSVRPEADHHWHQPGIRHRRNARRPRSRAFSTCYLRGGELIAVDTVNSPKDQMAARRLIAARARPNVDKLADHAVPMKDTV